MAMAVFPSNIMRTQNGIAKAFIQLRGDEKQEYMAMKVGYSRRQWIRWEMGVSIPSFRAMARIRKVYPLFTITY